jgi:hypothetical protein
MGCLARRCEARAGAGVLCLGLDTMALPPPGRARGAAPGSCPGFQVRDRDGLGLGEQAGSPAVLVARALKSRCVPSISRGQGGPPGWQAVPGQGQRGSLARQVLVWSGGAVRGGGAGRDLVAVAAELLADLVRAEVGVRVPG